MQKRENGNHCSTAQRSPDPSARDAARTERPSTFRSRRRRRQLLEGRATPFRPVSTVSRRIRRSKRARRAADPAHDAQADVTELASGPRTWRISAAERRRGRRTGGQRKLEQAGPAGHMATDSTSWRRSCRIPGEVPAIVLEVDVSAASSISSARTSTSRFASALLETMQLAARHVCDLPAVCMRRLPT